MNLWVRGGTLLTMNPNREVRRADLWIERGRIAGIGPRLRPTGKFRTLDASGLVVLPGLIHGHLHACQTLFRNLADGLSLLDWLKKRIWPLEAAHDEASLRASADLTFAELIRSGATAALDMGTVRHTDQVFESAFKAGFRLTSGKAMMDAKDGIPRGLQETTAGSVDESLSLLRRWHGAEGGRLRYAFAPRFVLSCTDDLLREVAYQSRKTGAGIHTHASENRSECQEVKRRTGRDNVAHLHALGLTGKTSTFAHCVWLSAKEEKILCRTGTVVCHCPSSNLKLASGVASVPRLLERGVSLALGADGAPCNNNLDLFWEMRLCALIHKPKYGPTAMPAHSVLEMATLGGAKALGLLHELGSLELGKRADFIAVSLKTLHATPQGEDLPSTLVHAAKSEDVRHSVIDGRVVMQDRVLLTVDAERVLAEAEKQAQRILRRVA